MLKDVMVKDANNWTAAWVAAGEREAEMPFA
jgi:hypothetical protein